YPGYSAAGQCVGAPRRRDSRRGVQLLLRHESGGNTGFSGDIRVGLPGSRRCLPRNGSVKGLDAADGRLSGYQARTILTMMLLVVVGKGLAFLREAFVASFLGASAATDGYYLALAMPTLIYSLAAIPYAMWVTARLAALREAGAHPQAASFYARSMLFTV